MQLVQNKIPRLLANGNLAPSLNGALKSGKQTRPVRPVKFCFHVDGSISVRVDGHWYHRQELDQGLYLSFPGEIRRRIMKRIVQLEFEDGRPRIEGSPVVVTTSNGA